jgi:hypothetical protein
MGNGVRKWVMVKKGRIQFAPTGYFKKMDVSEIKSTGFSACTQCPAFLMDTIFAFGKYWWMMGSSEGRI